MATKRNSRLTADITLETHNLLRDACLEYDSSKGKLIEKMIKKFLGSEIETLPVKKETKRSTFKPPTVEQVFNYCNERCNNVDAQSFVDHYTANNWMRGKAKIKDWKACVRTWEKNNKPKQNEVLSQSHEGQW